MIVTISIYYVVICTVILLLFLNTTYVRCTVRQRTVTNAGNYQVFAVTVQQRPLSQGTVNENRPVT